MNIMLFNSKLVETQALALSIQNIFIVATALAFVGLVFAFFIREISLEDTKDNTI